MTTLPPAPRAGTGPDRRDAFGPRHACSVLRARVAVWLRLHRQSLIILAVVLTACGIVHAVNFDGWPGRANDDEGTYTAQAYAMAKWGQVAHYTYWYDHPFGGWLLIAMYSALTDGFDRTTTAVTAARECMLAVHLVTCALMYLLSRRLGMRRLFAASAVLLFSLSPLALWFQRMAFLDNIAVLWVVAALACAASPRRSVAAATMCGIFMAFAFWSKETSLVLLPGVLLLLRQNRDPRNWRFARRNFAVFLIGICSIYFLYAALKNELFEGPGHVSLMWAVKWQLFNRPPSGSMLDPNSGTRGLVGAWLDIDAYLLLAGALAAVPALIVRRLRAVAFLLVMQVLLMFRNGYMPYAYVTAMLPFAALCIAGLADVIAPTGRGKRPTVLTAASSGPRAVLTPAQHSQGSVPLPLQRRPGGPTTSSTVPAGSAAASVVAASVAAASVPTVTAPTRSGGVRGRLRLQSWIRHNHPDRILGRLSGRLPRPMAIGVTATRALAVGTAAVLAVAVLPGEWSPKLHEAFTVDKSAASREATQWFIDHMPRYRQVVLTDDYVWTDLVRAGMDPVPIWFYKLDLDPAVRARAPNGWSDIDYVILGELAPSTMNDLPLVAQTIKNSVVVQSFGNGEIAIRRVVKPPCTAATPPGAKCSPRPSASGGDAD